MIWMRFRCGCSRRRDSSEISRPDDADAAGGRIDQPHDAARHRRFAGAALADDAERAALAQGEGDVCCRRHLARFAEQRALAIDLAELVGLQHHGLPGLGAWRPRHEAWHGSEQVAGIFHRRLPQDLVERTGLHEAAMAHHRDAIGDLGDDAHVVGDEQHGGAVIALQIADQGEDLLLRGDVERGGRLVGDQKLRLQHQRHRDHDALPLAAGQPVRVGREDTLHVGQPHMLHHLKDAPAPGAGVEIGVRAQHLVDLPADGHHRVERRHRLLEDHRHRRGAQLPQAPVARGEQLFADQLDAAAGSAPASPSASRPITVSEVTDLPEPLSPTRHSVSLSRTCSETPSMMRGACCGLAERDDEIVDVEDGGCHVSTRSLSPSFRARCDEATRTASTGRFWIAVARSQ